MTTKLAFNQIGGNDISVIDEGADNTGSTDSLAAFNSAYDKAKAVGGRVVIPAGFYYLSNAFSTDAEESAAVIIQGAGQSQCILAFDGTNGVELNGTGNVIRDVTIIDRSAWATPPASVSDFHSKFPVHYGKQTALSIDAVHTGTAGSGVLQDSTQSRWGTNDLVGYTVENLTDGSSGTITANTATTVTATLAGGTNNNWQVGDSYVVHNITLGGTGLLLARNNCTAENVQTMGFNIGQQTNETKFYMTLSRCRSAYNIHGFMSGDGVTVPNFCRSIQCFYNNNMKSNVWVRSGFHRFEDCAIEVCYAFNNNNASFPWGGVRINDPGYAVFEHCYREDANFYNDNKKTVVQNDGNNTYATVFAPTRFEQDQFGNKSVNLVSPPWVQEWNADANLTVDKAIGNVDEGHRYARLTTSAGAASGKVVRTAWNTSVRGFKPLSTENANFKIYVGFWVKLGSSNFTSGHPYFRVQFQDVLGTIDEAESATRTMVFDSAGFDNTNTTDWQYVGAFFPARYTLVSGNALDSVRVEITMEDSAEDASASNRVMLVSAPELRFYFETQGTDIDNNFNYMVYSEDNVSNPPTDAELDTIFGTPAQVGAGFSALIDDNNADTNVYRVHSTGASWWYDVLTKAT